MNLTIWVNKQAEKLGVYKTNVLKDLAKKSGVSFLTLQILERGGKMQNYDKAKAVSEATDGKVTIKDLCEKSE